MQSVSIPTLRLPVLNNLGFNHDYQLGLRNSALCSFLFLFNRILTFTGLSYLTTLFCFVIGSYSICIIYRLNISVIPTFALLFWIFRISNEMRVYFFSFGLCAFAFHFLAFLVNYLIADRLTKLALLKPFKD